MINDIFSGPGITVSNTSYSYGSNNLSINMSAPSAGMLRYNGNRIEVYDGTVWISLSGGNSASVSLNEETQNLLFWVRKKKQEEEELEKIAQSNETIADLVKQIKEKHEQIKVVQTLIRSELTSV